MRVRLLGLYWTMLFEPLFRYRTADGRRVDGLCDPPNAKNRKIHIDSGLEGKKKLEVILHECTHGADPSKTEEWVSQFAEDMAEIIWRCGFRDDKDSAQ